MKEKYISKRQGKFASYRVFYKGQSKTFSEKDYGTNALKMAVRYRNKLMEDDFVELHRVILVRDCFEEIKEFYNLRSETLRKYDSLYSKYLTRYGGIMITRLKKADVIESLNKMVKVATTDTIQRVFTIWKKIIYMANAKEYIEKDVTLGIIPPRSQKLRKARGVNNLDEEKLSQILKICDKAQLVYDRRMFPLILTTLYYTGLRPCECLALNKADVHDGIIDVNKELGSDRFDYSVIRTCKTETSVRTIPITDSLKPTIDRLLSEFGGDLLFPNRFGRYYDVNSLGDRIHKLCAKQGIQIHLYDFRHNFSTQLLKSGTDPRTHQELMGHKNYTMSVNYARSTEEQKKKAVDSL